MRTIKGRADNEAQVTDVKKSTQAKLRKLTKNKKKEIQKTH